MADVDSKFEELEPNQSVDEAVVGNEPGAK